MMAKDVWGTFMRRESFFLTLVLCVSLFLSGCGAGKKSYEKGVELAGKGDYQKATEYFKKAIKQNGERAEYYIGYGMALNAQGEYEAAVKQFEAARQDVKNSIANANNKQVFYGEAISYYYLADYDKSLEYCDKALEIAEPESMDVDILCSKGAILETAGETKAALEAYGQAIKKDSQNWEAYLKRASLEERMEQMEEAKADYQKVIQSDGKERYEACFKLYELCLSLGEADTPEQALQEIIASKSKDSFVTCQIGWAYHCQGDDENAQKYLEKSLEDGYVEAGYYLGMLAMKQEAYAEAQKFFESYLSSGEKEFQAMAYNQLAGCALESGEEDAAQTNLEKGLAVADSDSRACLWKNQIILWERQGEFGKAKKAAKEYLSVYPQDKGMSRELKFIKTRKTKKVVQGSTGENSPEPDKNMVPRGASQEMIQ